MQVRMMLNLVNAYVGRDVRAGTPTHPRKEQGSMPAVNQVPSGWEKYGLAKQTRTRYRW
jgi:hypothetical protein